MLLALLDAFDLVLAFLDFTVEEFDALAGVGGRCMRACSISMMMLLACAPDRGA